MAKHAINIDYRIEHLDGDLTVRADDSGFAYGWNAELVFAGVEYLELPYAWSGKSFRLANARERSYLRTRCDMRVDNVAVKIVDDELRPYFVVCTDVVVRGGGTTTGREAAD